MFRLPWQPHCDPVVLGSGGEVQQRAETEAASGRKQVIETVDSRVQLEYLSRLLCSTVCDWDIQYSIRRLCFFAWQQRTSSVLCGEVGEGDFTAKVSIRSGDSSRFCDRGGRSLPHVWSWWTPAPLLTGGRHDGSQYTPVFEPFCTVQSQTTVYISVPFCWRKVLTCLRPPITTGFSLDSEG